VGEGGLMKRYKNATEVSVVRGGGEAWIGLVLTLFFFFLFSFLDFWFFGGVLPISAAGTNPIFWLCNFARGCAISIPPREKRGCQFCQESEIYRPIKDTVRPKFECTSSLLQSIWPSS
jgi:hypothetical protein